MTATVIHISEFIGARRVKACDGTRLTPPAANDKTPKTLCEQCRKTIRDRKS